MELKNLSSGWIVGSGFKLILLEERKESNFVYSRIFGLVRGYG